MVSEVIRIMNPTGLHFRPTGMVCEKALTFSSKIEMKVGTGNYNLKSLLSVLSAQIAQPMDVEIICQGADEEEALETMREFLKKDFDTELKK